MKTMKAPPHSLADVPPTCLSDEAAERYATWATVVSKYLVLPHSTPNQNLATLLSLKTGSESGPYRPREPVR